MSVSRSLVPDLTVLQAFECAARHGSFTRAATELNLTQSAVSRQIRTLETQLGVVLFERVRKRVVLSSTGKALLADVAALLAQTEDLVLRAMAAADDRQTLTIATLPTFGNRWLLRRLPDFLKSYPETRLDITCRSEPFDLAREDFDLVIHYGQPVWAHAICTYLCSEVILPVASPALLKEFPVTEAADLLHLPLLHLATRPKLWTEWLQTHAGIEAKAFSGHRFDQFAMIIEAALNGLGFALLPDYLIEEELSSGRLQVVIDRPISTANGYYIVTPEGKKSSAIARAFETWLLQQV
ncbi:LysR family transcriptional regulator [Rhizobium paknamense]|uniref:LysR family glycine cleavage system transcriptional activator n=1 Tax=Rhizobium paknamense TaxID=1206817 RepID=A0ABU0IIU6_9HYPH|nr:LysR family transcriptional regulator [Rhizobium paknamense]MDQ0458179.1 LysR family glycine cleavage system transcriptional activator [Rhizobium paknamense]